MSASQWTVSRRSAVAAGATAVVMSILRPFGGVAHAQKAVLLAKQVPQIPSDPGDGVWGQAEALDVPLAPQAVVKPRRYEAGVSSVTARSLYDADRIAILLEWEAAEQSAGLGSVGSFRDAVAIEFPADATARTPHFAMGEPGNPVTIYQWKADWEFGRQFDADEQFPHMAADWYPFSGRAPGEIAEGGDYAQAQGAKVFHTSWSAGNTLGDLELQERTPVEKLQAEGFGTIGPTEAQDGQGKSLWSGGKWKVLISMPRSQEGFSFDQGKTIPIAFAAWNGSKGERGGEKAVSTWYFLGLEQSTSSLAYVSPFAVVAAAVLGQLVALRLLRRGQEASRPGQEQP